MKSSRYNIFVETAEGNALAFNSASAALAEIYPDKYPIIQKLLCEPESVVTDEEKELRAALIQGRFLVDDGVDEIEFLKVMSRTRRFDRRTFFLTIAPTLSCNFQCDYCFENQRHERMSEETEKALLDFSDKHIKRADSVMVTWFGGEPTLCLEIVERIQLGLRSLAEKHGAAMDPSSIVTNGYFLDGKMAKRLMAAGVTTAQITVDGPEKIHDQRRKLHNGKGTFRRIVENLEESSAIMKIVVRVNVDRQNYEMAFDVIEELSRRNVLPRVYVYFAQVGSSGGVCADIKASCFTTEEFSRKQVQLYRGLIENGFYQIEYPSLAPGGHCGADTDGSYVVTPDGSLYKCWEETSLDASHSVGSVFSAEPETHQKTNLNKFLVWDPFEKEKCLECNILPICMGGCPIHGMQNGRKDIGDCCSWKHNLGEMLTLRYLCDIKKTRV